MGNIQQTHFLKSNSERVVGNKSISVSRDMLWRHRGHGGRRIKAFL